MGFLHKRDRIDYSLLLGLQSTSALDIVPNSANKQWPTPEGNGLKSTASSGEAEDEVIFMGIIDILQSYTTRKMLEGMVKRTLHRVKTKKDKDEVEDNNVDAGEVRAL